MDVVIFANYEFLNPGGEQLPFEYIPLPKMGLAFAILWGILTVVWCANWIYHRHQTIKLHKFISTVFLFGIARDTTMSLLFKNYSITGYLSYTLFALYIAALVLWYFTFYSTLQLISKGYCIVQDKLDIRTYAIIFLLSFAQATCFFIEYFFTAVLIATFVADMIIFFVIFRSTSTSIKLLMVEAERAGQQPSDGTGQELNENRQRKIKMLRYFSWLTLAYIFLSFIVGALFRLIVDLSTIYNWLNFLYAELLDLLFFVGIAWTLRLRGRNIYFLLATEEPPSEQPPTELQSPNPDSKKQQPEQSGEPDSNITPN